MAATDTQPPAKTGPSPVVQLGMLAALTGAAIGLGWLSGAYLNAEQKPVEPKATAAEHGATKEEPEKPSTLVALPPITVNLAAPAQTWLRMEAVMVTNAPITEAEAENVHQDLLGYLRTLKLHQIEGASGFTHLKTDLQERASIRSGGRVTQVLIRTLLFE